MVYDLAAEEYSVYDLSAKIWPESDPVYDLTAIDTSRGRTASVEDQRPVVARRCAGYRSPSTVIAAAARSISARLSAVSSTLAAPRFSSSRWSLVVPGIGTIQGFRPVPVGREYR